MRVLARKKKKNINKKEDFDFLSVLKDCEKTNSDISNLILREIGDDKEVLELIKSHFNFCLKTIYFTSTSTKFNIDKLENDQYCSIVNLKKINDVRYINKFFESVNSKLPNSGFYFGKVETYPNRRRAILKKYPIVINWLVYLIDTIFTRVIPKLLITKKLYFYLTKGKGRVISRAETYGRLYSCGFKIVDEKSINNHLYFLAKKVKEPFFDKNPTYGPIVRLTRIGKGKRRFKVYKLRTMHPYSEYLQEYAYEKNKLQDGGKIKNDFRISPEGRVLRKFWIDEIPMLINVLKGDLKIVGVRPLSEHYFSLYSKELQDLRTQVKPGFIPPFYADNPKTLKDIMESEKRYILSYKKHPFSTDLNYLVKALNNVLFKGIRSF